jgi:hypothetical protein
MIGAAGSLPQTAENIYSLIIYGKFEEYIYSGFTYVLELNSETYKVA